MPAISEPEPSTIGGRYRAQVRQEFRQVAFRQIS